MITTDDVESLKICPTYYTEICTQHQQFGEGHNVCCTSIKVYFAWNDFFFYHRRLKIIHDGSHGLKIVLTNCICDSEILRVMLYCHIT